MKTCDNATVGVLIERDGRWLMIWRANFPPGVAPVAGHVYDEHASYEDAARAEVAEETGLHVEALSHTGILGWQPNRCRRAPGTLGIGHVWLIYLATVSGQVKPSEREAQTARWLSQPEIQVLAERTVRYARNEVTGEEFALDPGIEPVWVSFLVTLGLVFLPAEDMALVSSLAASMEPS